MTTTLITGANEGLGYETARRLLAHGHDVWIAARDIERGHRAADELGARFVRLDVTDDESVRRAAETVQAQAGLDVLINNAGIAGGFKPAAEVTALLTTQYAKAFPAMRINAVDPGYTANGPQRPPRNADRD